MNAFLSRCITVGVILVIAIAGFDAWLNARAVRRQLDASIRAQEAVIANVNAGEAKRDESLKDALNEISRVKQATKTPLQIITELPKYIRLPAPIRSTSATPRQSSEDLSLLRASTVLSTSGDASLSPGGLGALIDEPPSPERPTGAGSNPDVELPAQDLKPLFDFVQDCRSCEIELEAVRQDASANSVKLAAMSHERDLALKAAKGGSNWIRLRRDLKWFAAGALAAYVALR